MQRATISLTTTVLPIGIVSDVVAHALLNQVAPYLQLPVCHRLCGFINAKAGLGVDESTESMTYRQLQERRDLIQKRMRDPITN